MKVKRDARLLKPWQSKLIARRAKRFGLRGAELDDVCLNIALEVRAFKYDPACSNGATPATALTALIDHRLTDHLRRRQCYQDHLDRFAQATLPQAHEVDGEADRSGLQLDVQSAIANLSAEEQHICIALGRGQSRAAIAEQLGWSWHKLDRAVQRVRERFQGLGLEEWLCG